jgi:hypothetical protein
MSGVHWAGAIDGDFNTAADWSGGVVPGASDDAILDAAGGAFRVRAASDESVASIQTATNATLDIAGMGTVFQTALGTGGGANAGAIQVRNQATLRLAGGTVRNTGAISLDDATIDIAGSAGVTLTGGGTIALSDSADNRIAQLTPLTRSALVNINNTIAGAGYIENNYPQGLSLTNQHAGVIDATGTNNRLVIKVATLANAGLVEGTGAAGLQITNYPMSGSTYVNNNGGVILAGDGSRVILDSQVAYLEVRGGALATAGSGYILASEVILEGVENRGRLDISDSTLRGAIANSGDIHLTSPAEFAHVYADHLSLSGGGTLTLGVPLWGFVDNIDNTITGEGRVDAREFSNGVQGVISETGSAGINVYYVKYFENAGLIESVGAGGIGFGEKRLRAFGVITNIGTIEASGAGHVEVKVSVFENDGLLAVNGGTITASRAITGTGAATLDGGTLDVRKFDQDVTFTGATGTLLLRHRGYRASVAGFSTAGGTILDLRYINFATSHVAFRGDAGAGVLRVTDGVHSARIHLTGDFLGVPFAAADDGALGVAIHAVATHTPCRPDAFAAAMAGLAPGAGGLIHAADHPRQEFASMLSGPRAAPT